MTSALTETSKELFNQFAWFYQQFNTAVQNSSDDFLYEGLEFKLLSLSKNMNALFQDDSYFVTKIKADASNEVYIRSSDKAVQTILERGLGKSRRSFSINNITELEAKVITGFNDNLYNFISGNFIQQYQQTKKFDIYHLTFLVKDKETNLSGKIIVSFPEVLIHAENIVCLEEKFSSEYFYNSFITVNIRIGTTIFTVQDLKSLEVDDIVLLENSNLQQMTVIHPYFKKDFRITPNPGFIISLDNSGGEDMATETPPANLWDSIQVEMGAEFDKVKISLGELKNIEEGLVVDISSVYNNNITLKVEEKVIAVGELVIINDRYGVKINKIFAEPKQQPQVNEPQQISQNMGEQMPMNQMPMDQMEQMPQMAENYGEPMPDGMETMDGIPQDGEDFDYSDFELDDEDI